MQYHTDKKKMAALALCAILSRNALDVSLIQELPLVTKKNARTYHIS